MDLVTLYKRLFAWMYHIFLSDRGTPDPDDPALRDVRIPLLAQASGDVLEIGAGDGTNLAFYPPGVRLTLLDSNPHMLAYLHETADRLGIAEYRAAEGFAEDLPFPDGRFDTVVSIHVLCSVADQEKALGEVRRVLRPGGLFLFLEHVSAPPGTATYRVQRLVNPVWRLVGDGCHLTRDTGAAIREAGFKAVEVDEYRAGFPEFVSLHVFGQARA
jgi:ubiquinone/menaquinone biosynthesis C-methylase UbiE